MELMRSLMFVPGHRPRMIQRALGIGEFTPTELDVAILDLEDGVPRDEKDRARAAIAAALGEASRGESPARYVRVNRNEAARDADLAAVLRPGLAGLVVPKVDRAAEVEGLARDLDEREAAAKLSPDSVKLVASIETARGLIEAYPIAASSGRVIALLFGAEDFARDLALPTERVAEAEELLHARSAVVVAAVAARRIAIDGIWPDVNDTEGLRRDAVRGRRLGFAGKSLIHPGQIETINEVFSPSATELAHARRVVEAFHQAQARGDGAVALDGKLLDEPIVERARATVRLYEIVSRKERTPPVERPAALEGKRLK
jgi:citrate lyase subunit beta/citryl-CoA lyase